MENKKVSSMFVFIFIIVFVSIITNPSTEMQRQIIYSKQNSLVEEYLCKNSDFTTSNNFQKNMNLVAGSVFMNALISQDLIKEITINNFLAFSVLKYTKDNENQIIGIGAFGRIYLFSNKTDEILKDKVEGSMKSFDLYKNEIGL